MNINISNIKNSSINDDHHYNLYSGNNGSSGQGNENYGYQVFTGNNYSYKPRLQT